MKIVVIGAGKVGRSIIENVCMEGHDIIVIDNNPKLVNQLIETYNIMGVCGNGATLDVQNECDISDADLVVGSHPHVIQPREIYNDKEIVYSLGNFCYGGNRGPENRTIIYQMTQWKGKPHMAREYL